MTSTLLAAGWVAVVLTGGWIRRPLGRWRGLAPPRVAPASPRRARAASRWRGWAALLGAGLLGLAMFGPVGALGVTGALLVGNRARRTRAAGRETARRQARLPDAVELLAVAVAAGLTPRQGLHLVAERGPLPLRPAFHEVTSRMDAGEPLALALPRLTASLGEPARSLVRAITVAERDGVPVRALLSRLADDARRQRRQDLEAAVRRLPVRLTFPLACCALPAFVLLTVVPLLAAGLHRLGPLGPLGSIGP